MPSESGRKPWEIYNDEMSKLSNGHALWEPAPLSHFDRIRPGDVGYIRDGCFNLLFSASCPPDPLNKLDTGQIDYLQPRAPGYLTPNLKTTAVRFKCTPLIPPPSAPTSPQSPAPMLGPDSSIRFQFRKAQGAALVTRFKTYREKVREIGRFEQYVKKNHASWVDFARDAGYGDIDPILVTGVDRTKDFAMMCYSDYDQCLECEFRTSAHGTPSAFAWGTWETTRPINQNHGPQLCCPPSAQTTSLASSGNSHAGTGSDEYNQCVFIRYFGLLPRKLGVPKRIVAMAGPHNLNMWGPDGEGSSLQAQYDSGSDSDISSGPLDSDCDNGTGSVTSVDSGSETGTVFHNPTTDERSDFGVIADYVFQNSEADFTLIHHEDIALLREPGGNIDLSVQLLKKRPLITVDENGVGTIIPQADLSAEHRSNAITTPTPMSITGETGHEAAKGVASTEPHLSPHPGRPVLLDDTHKATAGATSQLSSAIPDHDFDNKEVVKSSDTEEGDKTPRLLVVSSHFDTNNVGSEHPVNGKRATSSKRWLAESLQNSDPRGKSQYLMGSTDIVTKPPVEADGTDNASGRAGGVIDRNVLIGWGGNPGQNRLTQANIPLGESPPPVPRACFGRGKLIEKVVSLVENLSPIALIGAVGIGKTSIALTVLHHNRVKERFGENRRFIRCDQFPASRVHFLARLSKVIGAGVENAEDLTPLRPFLSSKEMLIILDNAEYILDPKGTNAEEIYSLMDELCEIKTISLCITSRITMVPPRCKRPKIPTLSMEAACDIFYGIHSDGERSSIIGNLLQRLDFHALSITLLATASSHNGWDYDRLASEWDIKRAQVLQTDYNESLAATIELSLTSPTFHSLGPNARDLLGVIAFFPQGVDEKNLDWLFPTISNRRNMFEKFRALSLTYRSNGFVTMLAPIRDYLSPRDPQSSPLLCAARDHYFSRLSTLINPGVPGFEEGGWIVSEDVNVEHLLDVFTSINPERGDIWDVCFSFIRHLDWYKPRQTMLESKIEALADDHDSKLKRLPGPPQLFRRIGNHAERKRLLTHTLELQRRRKDDLKVAETSRYLSEANLDLGVNEEGIRQAKEALEIFERVGDVVGQVNLLSGISWLLFNDKQLDAANDAASRAIVLASGGGQEYLICRLHQFLGLIHRSKGEKGKAIHHFEIALIIASTFNWHDSLFWTHYDLAHFFCDEGEFDDANFHTEQAKPHTLGDAYELGCVRQMQADIWYLQGRLEDAKSEVLCALDIFEKLGAAYNARVCKDLLQMVVRPTKTWSVGFKSLA